jgi:hypothetical protein
VGHDDAESVFDPLFAKSSQRYFSFLFCGIGDARNMFATLADIGLESMQVRSFSAKKLYFSLVDIKPAVFARDLVMFRMLNDCSREPDNKRQVTLGALAFTFSGHIMPPWVYDRQQTAMKKVAAELKMYNSHVMGRFHIDAATRDVIYQHLQNWQKAPQSWYSTSSILAMTRRQFIEDGIHRMMRSVDADVQRLPGCEPRSPDVREYADLNFMLPSVSLLNKHEPQLLALLTAYGRSGSPGTRQKLEQHVRADWKPNMTLIDFDWEAKREGPPQPSLDFLPFDVVHDLFGCLPISILLGPDVSGFYGHLVGSFDVIATCWRKIRNQTMVEMIVGDMADFMERAEHDVPGRGVSGVTTPSEFPRRYDSVHLSNIPDYVGGPLTTFLHGLPVLRHDHSSVMISRVLRNPPHWITHEDFLTEYLLLSDRQKIEATFCASLSEQSLLIEREISGQLAYGRGIMMAQPFSWTQSGREPLPWSKLMGRKELEKWLHMLFFKLNIPFGRPKEGTDLVYAPLNMTIFFRLILHLFRIGYPSHWLSEILASLSSGAIITEARAPRVMIMDAAHVNRVHPKRKMSVRPFVEEFRTLFAVWRHLLPFGTHLPDTDVVPQIDAIRQFTLRFTMPPYLTHMYLPVFVLVLWNASKNGKPPVKGLRQVLLDDEQADSAYEGVRQAGRVHVISALKWEMEISRANFWFTDSTLQSILSGDGRWDAYIWRTDTWTSVLGPLPVNESTLVCGNTWC